MIFFRNLFSPISYMYFLCQKYFSSHLGPIAIGSANPGHILYIMVFFCNLTGFSFFKKNNSS